MKDNWEKFTVNNLPPQREPLLLMYKGLLWKVDRDLDQIIGYSPMGEIKLQTTVVRILEHDKENGDVTKWRR